MDSYFIDRLASQVKTGRKDKRFLIDAMKCFVKSESHLELIPFISSLLPAEQFSEVGFWDDDYYFENPVRTAVMHCSSVDVFRVLRDIGYSMHPVHDFQFYPDPSGFLEILGMDMPGNAEELYEIAAERLARLCFRKTDYAGNKSGKELYGGTDIFSFSGHFSVSPEIFDIAVADFIEFGRKNFPTLKSKAVIAFDLCMYIILNPVLTEAGKAYLNWIDNSVFGKFYMEDKSKLVGAAIWAGNKVMYDYLAKVFSDDIHEIYQHVHIRLNGKADYSNGFIEELTAANGPLSERKRIVDAIYWSLKTFPADCCPYGDVLSFLFAKIGNPSEEDFPESLSAAFLKCNMLKFRDSYAEILDCINRWLPGDLSRKDEYGRSAVFYASDDADAVRYIAERVPESLAAIDNEGKNVLHFFFENLNDDEDFLDLPMVWAGNYLKQIIDVLPEDLLTETDCYGKYPYEYSKQAELFELIAGKRNPDGRTSAAALSVNPYARISTVNA